MGPLIQVCVSRKIIISLLDENSGNGNGNGNGNERFSFLFYLGDALIGLIGLRTVNGSG